MAERGPVCLIVGMGTGVSLGVARRFGGDGYAIGMLARRRAALDDAERLLAAEGITSLGVVADAGRPDSLRSGIDAVRDGLGPIEVLVYNALSSHRGPPGELDPADAVEDLRVNAVGALVAARAVAPALVAAGRGTILLTGGGLALEPMPVLASLAMGKAALRSLAGSLAGELEPRGVRVGTVTICGAVRDGTPLGADRVAEAFHTLHTQPPGAPYEIVLEG